MVITATEFKANFGKYMDAALTEDIFVTKNGKVLIKVSNPAKDKLSLLDSLVGIAPAPVLDEKQNREERLARQ